MGMKEIVTASLNGNISSHRENQSEMKDRADPVRRTCASIEEIARVSFGQANHLKVMIEKPGPG
jgi:hypothetical protein